MANISKLITTTVRDPDKENARLELLRANAYKKFLAFEKEMIELTGNATGLGSSKWAVGEQKNYKIIPGGPKNLDLDNNSLCRYTPSPSSKMGVSPNGDDLESKLGKLGGLQNSRFSPKVYGNATNRLNSQSSSGQSALKANATVFTPSKAKTRSSSLSGSAQSFTPKSAEASSSSGGGVSLVSSPTTVVKDITAKRPNHQKVFEQILLADYQKRMNKFQTVTPTEVNCAEEAVVVPVSPPTVAVETVTPKKQTPEKLFEQIFLAEYQKRMNKVQLATPTEANTAGNENVSIASQEPSDVFKSSSVNKSIDVPVVVKSGGAYISDTSSSHGSSQAVSAAPSIMKENEFMEMLVKAQVEKDAKRASISASSTAALSIAASSIAVPPVAAPSISGSPIPAYVPISPLPVSRDVSGAGIGAHLSLAPTQPVIAGPSMMKENEFMVMLIKEQQEKALKRESIIASALTIKKEDIKVNIPGAKSDFPLPQTQNSANDEVISKINNIVENKSELPITEKSTFATQTKIPNITAMSNKPLIPAPINKWTTANLTQGKSLCKSDEDFQTFLANKTAAALDAARAKQQNVTKPLSPKPTPTKPTQAETDADKRKLGAGQADFNVLLSRRFANTPTSPHTKLPINNANTPGLTRKSGEDVFAIPEAVVKGGQAILAELQAASKDLVTNFPVIKKENVIDTNHFDEKDISAWSTVNTNLADTAGNLAAFKGESSQDKTSHVAVHRFTPNENAINTNSPQVNNPFNDKLFDKKQAGSLVSSPPFWSVNSLPDIDIGDKMDNNVVDPNFKEGVRVTATQDANLILRDWDGSWCPPPIWEERGAFDAAYIPNYIQEWSSLVSPERPVTTIVDTSAEGFISGQDLVNNVILSKAPKHEPTIPDTLNSSNEKKRLNQTAGQEAAAFLKKVEKAQKAREHYVMTSNAYQQELLAREPEPNPYAPKIEIYLRPATEADAKQILQIYNHYITESYIPEDQEPLTESDIQFLIEVTKKEKLPFVVAVKGRVPAQSANPKVKTKVPQYENIISFGYTEMRGCGIAGKAFGRSRYTHNLHLFVHHDYTRKGVGSCVLDRLLQVSSRAWAGHDGYDWLNPDNDPAYGLGCGARCHQMLIEVPVLTKNDPNYEWMKNFLRKFWFMEEFRLKSVGRTNVAKREGEWLDVVHFQKQLEHEAEFTPFV
ncbi:hypothetical protein NHQ30_005512 [Ciborinia camelliae]|nr:hypothetical protein NHQ30_005512 [Ciborinia camelliae]